MHLSSEKFTFNLFVPLSLFSPTVISKTTQPLFNKNNFVLKANLHAWKIRRLMLTWYHITAA